MTNKAFPDEPEREKHLIEQEDKRMNTLKNSVRLTGFLGSAPEMKTFNEQRHMAKVSLATHERYRNNQGEWETDTQWHQLIFWGKKAKFAEKCLDKGMEVAIEGRLNNRTYEDKEGIKRHVAEIVVNEFMMITRKVEAEETLLESEEDTDES